MSDAAVECVHGVSEPAHYCLLCSHQELDRLRNQFRAYDSNEKFHLEQIADLTARLASAERTIGEFKATNRLLYGERDTLKAAIEQARYAELERTTALLNEIMPRYREMFEAAGLGDFTQSIVFQIASDALASAAGGRRE